MNGIDAFAGAVLCAACGIPFVRMARRAWLALRSIHWPSTQALLILGSSGREWLGMLRESDAHYLYTVAGREYRSTQLTFKSIPYIPPWALYDRPYRGPNGVPIVVFYDPQKPSRAVLLPGPDVLNFAGTAILGLFTVAAIWLEWLILVSDR